MFVCLLLTDLLFSISIFISFSYRQSPEQQQETCKYYRELEEQKQLAKEAKEAKVAA